MLNVSLTAQSTRALLAASLLLACGSPPTPNPPQCVFPPASAVPTAVPAAPGAAATLSSANAATANPALTPVLLTVHVKNPARAPRSRETIELQATELLKLAPALELGKTLVFDEHGALVLSQLVSRAPDSAPSLLIFQTDLAGGESKTFTLRAGERKIPAASEYRAYGRFVRERHDDFAWENDLVAHRTYGPALETAGKESLISSGMDVWAKRSPRLLVNEWYMTDDYHQDHGDGADLYSVGKTRGCGGLGIWAANKLFVSHNFTSSHVLANGPIRLIFELDYAAWDAAGVKVSETKRVSLDAGSVFNHFESTLKFKGRPVQVGLGIAKHAGATPSFEASPSSLRVWEPGDNQLGFIGCAVVLPAGSAGVEQHTDSDYLLVTTANADQPTHYYVGSAWDRAGRIATPEAWGETVRAESARLAAPVQVDLSAGSPPATTPPAAK